MAPAFLGECDYPNVGVWGDLLASILILFQTLFVHLVKHIYDKRQLSKIGALSTYSRALSVSIRESLIKQVVTRGRAKTR